MQYMFNRRHELKQNEQAIIFRAKSNTTFRLTHLKQLYLNQIKFQPIKCTRFVELSNQKAPFYSPVPVWFKLVLLANVNGVYYMPQGRVLPNFPYGGIHATILSLMFCGPQILSLIFLRPALNFTIHPFLQIWEPKILNFCPCCNSQTPNIDLT